MTQNIGCFDAFHPKRMKTYCNYLEAGGKNVLLAQARMKEDFEK